VALLDLLAQKMCLLAGAKAQILTQQAVRTLQRTSISTNIKERLDFSCGKSEVYLLY
jgi:N-methylhydantoinase B/oxoprolinase/acetone carboxylase alpha subunit